MPYASVYVYVYYMRVCLEATEHLFFVIKVITLKEDISSCLRYL